MRHVFEDVTVTIDNNTFCNQTGQSVLFSDYKKDPQYAGIFLSNIFAYDDKADLVNLPSTLNYRMNVLDYFDWHISSIIENSVSFVGTPTDDKFKGSSLSFDVSDMMLLIKVVRKNNYSTVKVIHYRSLLSSNFF